MSDDPSLLSRWSARKRAVAAEDAAPDLPANDAAQDDAAAAARAVELDANRLAAEAVDLETLDKDSDLSLFLRDGVPDLLRKAALQKVWRSNPIFANLDELVDYGEDFGRKELIMETFTSAWQAGRGYLKKVAADPLETDGPEADTSDVAPPPEDKTEATAAPEADIPDTTDRDPDLTAKPAETQADQEDPVAETSPPDPAPTRSGRGSLRARLAIDTDTA